MPACAHACHHTQGPMRGEGGVRWQLLLVYEPQYEVNHKLAPSRYLHTRHRRPHFSRILAFCGQAPFYLSIQFPASLPRPPPPPATAAAASIPPQDPREEGCRGISRYFFFFYPFLIPTFVYVSLSCCWRACCCRCSCCFGLFFIYYYYFVK